MSTTETRDADEKESFFSRWEKVIKETPRSDPASSGTGEAPKPPSRIWLGVNDETEYILRTTHDREVEGLREALRRMRSQFIDALAGRPVMCADETIAEADAALKAAQGKG